MTPTPPPFKKDKSPRKRTRKQAREAREEWLQRAIEHLRPLFEEKGYTVPKLIRVSVGFPYGAGRRALGQCFDTDASADHTNEVFISPMTADPVVVLATLVHEVAHTVVGVKEKHNAHFKRCVTEVGLEGKATATHAGEALAERLHGIAKALGPYPHAELVPIKKQKQTTRLIKVLCPECDYVARVTRIHLDEKGAPICPVCRVPFIEEQPGEDAPDPEDER